LVKILVSGEIDLRLVFEVQNLSDSDRQKIENAGGQAKVIGRD
jgi:ribosomal protein L15